MAELYDNETKQDVGMKEGLAGEHNYIFNPVKSEEDAGE